MSPKLSRMLVNEISPRISSAIRKGAVKTVGSEDAEEIAQDGLAIAANILESAERRSRKITPGNIAYFALQTLKSGRRSTSASRTDAMSAAAALDGGTSLESLDEVNEEASDGEMENLHELLAADGEYPDARTAREIDWNELMPRLSSQGRRVINNTAAGESVKSTAKKCGVSSPRIVRIKRKIADTVSDLWGDNVLHEIAASPIWDHGLNAVREKAACRYERRAC